ncbi:MAG TPA: branched-chain amino acid ABC transporter permease [Ktedonobacteraceae bacterium]|jgi:ABC-type branched-subunit amino acid transport system permease subunit|nr:branched-chain amino acid ABC transporter permease [Ktedonobacteraceae bacterium]
MSVFAIPKDALGERDTRFLLIKWIVALLVPLAIFTFVWSGEAMINQVILGVADPNANSYSLPTIAGAGVFVLIFYASVIALAGYFVAADSGRRGLVELWIDILIFVMVPLFLFIVWGNLILSLSACVIIWPLYFLIMNRIRKARNIAASVPLANVAVLNQQQQTALKARAIAGSFWFATIFSLVFLAADLIFMALGSPFPPILLAWVVVRTLLLPVVGYFLGRVGAFVALRRALTPEKNVADVALKQKRNGVFNRISRKSQLENLSTSRATEEAKDLVPNDLPLRSKGAQRFYITLLVLVVALYPILDPILFGAGTAGRLDGYGDAGYYIILALGLNIVVGFAGLLDMGYVAFFAIGAYVWGLFGSPQWQVLTHMVVNPTIWPWFFWPMLLVAALIAALWGLLLGAPTLRLRGDYLAIVTLGFGEIVPIFFLELDKYTNGTNGLVGVFSPALFGVDWTTPVPYYYLILALIALLIFVNVRLRDSRIGRAWVALREDEIAASSSGINLTNTKLLAFAAGAFFSGIAGMYHAAKLGTVTPDNFSTTDSIIYLAMVVIGGLGSIPGVMVGAFVVYAIQEFILTQLDTLAADPHNFLHFLPQFFPGFTFGNIRNLIFGAILVAVIIFRPEGMLPSMRRRRELHHVETEEVEVGALDAIPGSAEFESEVPVE